MGFFGGDFFYGNRPCPGSLIDLDQWPRCWPRAWHNHVAQQYGEGLVSNQVFCDKYRVTEAQRFFLPSIAEAYHATDFADQLRLFGLAAIDQELLQLRRRIKMILNGIFPAAGHDDNVLDPD